MVEVMPRPLAPEKTVVDLACFEQILKLLKTRKGAMLEGLRRQVDSFKQLAKLPGTR